MVVMGNVGDNSVSSCRLHSSETQQLAYDTLICYLCGVAIGGSREPSTNDGPTCNTPVKRQIVIIICSSAVFIAEDCGGVHGDIRQAG